MDDAYKISLYELLPKTDLSSIQSLKESLDNNGYYGRYKLVEVRNECIRTDKYKLKIYLVDSMIHYLWPKDGYIKIKERFKNLKNHVNDPEDVKYVLEMIEKNPEMDSMLYSMKTGTNKRNSEMLFDFIHDHKLIRHDGKFVLKSEIDIDEYLANNIISKT